MPPNRPPAATVTEEKVAPALVPAVPSVHGTLTTSGATTHTRLFVTRHFLQYVQLQLQLQ
jgi:hypothetical protein